MVSDNWFQGAVIGQSDEFLLAGQIARSFREDHGACIRIHDMIAQPCNSNANADPAFLLVADGGERLGELLLRLFVPVQDGATAEPDIEVCARQYRSRLEASAARLRSCNRKAPLVIVPPFMPFREPPSDGTKTVLWEAAVALTRRYARIASEVAQEVDGAVVTVDLPWDELQTPVSWTHLGVPTLAPAGTYHLGNEISRAGGEQLRRRATGQ